MKGVMNVVSRPDVSTDGMDVIAAERAPSGRPAAPPRTVPASFGLRAAVLAGVVIMAAAPVSSANAHARARGVAGTVALGTPLSGLRVAGETGCCTVGH